VRVEGAGVRVQGACVRVEDAGAANRGRARASRGHRRASRQRARAGRGCRRASRGRGMQLLYSTNAGPRYHGSLNLCALLAWVLSSVGRALFLQLLSGLQLTHGARSYEVLRHS
jgi:hypothetical protein